MPMIVTNPNVTRSRLVLEIASEMIGGNDPQAQPDFYQAKAVLRATKPGGKTVTLFGSSTAEGIEAVARGEADLGIINPACVLSVALRGKGQFRTPQPVRAIGVIPSWDQFVFAVRPETGLESFEDIAAKRPKLRVSMRGTPDHTLHAMFDDAAAAAGFSRADLEAWGSAIRMEGALPYPDSPKFAALLRGEIDAIFDEAAPYWVNEALDAGIRVLPLAEATMRTLEAMGYHRALMPKRDFPKLPRDVLTLDFSGWTIFVRENAEDALVEQICAGLDARKARIPWEEAGPLPVERMARDARDTPQLVPLHPAAERFWRGRGYLG
ncbi:MAG TPA: TAXI family TRAP transporter solute-binding subunit [Stellaceae bacterium]|nr:TAXI family TRAP transporter solute-binding subunit [Stellaceae bacterium]